MYFEAATQNQQKPCRNVKIYLLFNIKTHSDQQVQHLQHSFVLNNIKQ